MSTKTAQDKMEEVRCYSIDVKVNDKYMIEADDKVIIYMKLLLKDEKVDGLSFGSNHEIVNDELHRALDWFQLWIKQQLPHPEIITKLEELDRLQYGHEIACDKIGLAIARLYDNFTIDNPQKTASSCE